MFGGGINRSTSSVELDVKSSTILSIVIFKTLILKVLIVVIPERLGSQGVLILEGLIAHVVPERLVVQGVLVLLAGAGQMILLQQ